MILQKYEPKTTAGMIGNKRQVEEIRRFLVTWRAGRGLIVSGPTGCGKTLSVKLVAKEMEFDIVESSGDMERNKAGLAELMEISKQRGFFNRKLILIEDTELLEGKRYLADLIAESRHPVVIITENPTDVAAYRLCATVRMTRIDSREMEKFLRNVCDRENVEVTNEMIGKIAKAASGDLRAALIDIESFSGEPGTRSQAKNMDDLLKAIFSNDRKRARELMENFSDYNLLFMWLCENIHTEYRTDEEMVTAYELLSRADIASSRIIKRQSWTLQKYVMGMLMEFPNSRKLLSRYNQPFRRRVQKEILEKIAERTHVSKKRASSYLPLVAAIRS